MLGSGRAAAWPQEGWSCPESFHRDPSAKEDFGFPSLELRDYLEDILVILVALKSKNLGFWNKMSVFQKLL